MMTPATMTLWTWMILTMIFSKDTQGQCDEENTNLIYECFDLLFVYKNDQQKFFKTVTNFPTYAVLTVIRDYSVALS